MSTIKYFKTRKEAKEELNTYFDKGWRVWNESFLKDAGAGWMIVCTVGSNTESERIVLGEDGQFHGAFGL